MTPLAPEQSTQGLFVSPTQKGSAMTTVGLHDLSSAELAEFANKNHGVTLEDIESTGHLAMTTLGSSGDVKAVWDPNDPKEVKAVKKLFTALMSQGRAAFKAAAGGAKGDQIRSFEEAEGSIIMTTALQGG